MSPGRGDAAALMARRDLGLGEDSPLPDVLRLVEQSGVYCFGLQFGDRGIDGAYQRARECSFLLFNVDKSPQRSRFTIAHEFGHHALDHGSRPDEQINPASKDPREREANAFAAAFLMPGVAVERWLESHGALDSLDLEALVRLAADFGVSAQAMRYRLINLGRLGRSPASRLDKEIKSGKHSTLARSLNISNQRDSVADAYSAGVWLPSQHQQTMLDLLDSGRISEEVVLGQLPEGVDVEALRALATPDAEAQHAALD